MTYDFSFYTETSSILGLLSICCWIIVFTPQMYKNYRRKSGESLSLLFLWIWLIGDIFNIVGAVMENLLPTMIILGIYFAIADLIIIGQVYHYRSRLQENEIEPLLGEFPNVQQIVENDSFISAMPNESKSYMIYNIICFLLSLYFIGLVIGFSLLFGWLSAILYVGSRIPQIMKNMSTKSVEGLSLIMFIFSITGNILYCLSIFYKSVQKDYILLNLPWLLGAGGTMIFDIIIFIQFVSYSRNINDNSNQNY